MRFAQTKKMKKMKLVVLFLSFTSLFAESPLLPEADSGWSKKEEVISEKMMVVSANPLASAAGLKVLEEGGNAIDAAVAVQMVLGVVEPQSSGLGGGAYLLFYRKRNGKVFFYDGRETAPKDVDETLFLDAEGKAESFSVGARGGKSVGVPGLLRMLEQVHGEYGEVAWDQLFQPAIAVAEGGFTLSPRMHKVIGQSNNIPLFAHAREYLLQDDLSPKPAGRVLKNAELAKSYRAIAQEGSSVFYSGYLAKELVETIQESKVNPGKLTATDLVSYQPEKREPLTFDYNKYKVTTVHPSQPGGGVVLRDILHRVASPEKNSMASPTFIDQFCRASRSAFDKLQERCDISSTSHFCIVDGEGNAVAMTTTIGSAFGSKLMVGGFFLNNELADFTFDAKSNYPNRVQPGIRPTSAMVPTFVFDQEGNLTLAIGSAGGTVIVDYVAQALLGILSCGMGVEESLAFPHYVSVGEAICLEEGTDIAQSRNALEEMGNRVFLTPLTSGTQAIYCKEGKLIGAADPRREGAAAGIAVSHNSD